MQPREVRNAKSRTMTRKDALTLLAGADQLYAAKGKKVVHVDLKRARPGEADLLALVLGPTGNLRAPTLKLGRTLIVGFDQSVYERFVR